MTVRSLTPILTLAALPMIVVTCAPVERPTDTNPAAGAPVVRVLGAAERCVMRDRLRQTVVRTNRVIDFEMQSGKVYRSILPNTCPGLGFNHGITYETSINQLCSNQFFYALENFGGAPRRGAVCSLGEFVPVEYVKDTDRGRID